MKRWLWIFAVLIVSVGIVFWTETNRFIPMTGPAPQKAFIVDRQGQAMIDELYQRGASNDVRELIKRYQFFLLSPEAASLHEAHFAQPIMIAYQELTAHPELTNTVKKWIGQGIEVYFYGDEIVPSELERKLGITLEHKSSEKQTAGGETEFSYQVIGYGQQKQTRVLFSTIQVALEKESYRKYDGPSAHPDSFLRTVLLDAMRPRHSMQTRNSIVLSGEFREPLVVDEDLLNTLFLATDDGELVLLADLSSHVDLYQHRNESDQEHDYFFLTHGTRVTTYNESQNKRMEVHHNKPFDGVHLMESGPYSQKGKTFDAMIYRDLRWSYGNEETVELRTDHSQSNDYVSWTVTPRWWQRGLEAKHLVVPGSFWASTGSYVGVDVTQRAQIGYQFNEYWMGSTRAVRYDYETGYVQP